MTFSSKNIDHISSVVAPVVQAESAHKYVPQGRTFETYSTQASCDKNVESALRLDAPGLPGVDITQDSSTNDDMIAILCTLIRSNGEFSQIQSENFVKVKHLAQTMSTIVCEKANESFRTQTQLKEITDEFAKKQEEHAKVSNILEIVSWVVFGVTTAVSLGAAIAPAIAGVIGRSAATVAVEEASAAAAGQAAREVELTTMRAAVGSANSSVASSASSAAESGAVRGSIDEAVLNNQLNPVRRMPWGQLGKFSAGLVGAGLGSTPIFYNAHVQLQMADQLEKLAQYQLDAGKCRAEVDSCGQMVSYWGQSLERCTNAINTVVEAEKDTLDVIADYFQLNKQMASMISNSRRI